MGLQSSSRRVGVVDVAVAIVILLSQESVKTWGLILGLTGVNKFVIVEYRTKNRSEFVKIHWTKGKTLKSLTQNVLPSWIDVC